MTSKNGLIKILAVLILICGANYLCHGSSWAEGKQATPEDYQIRLGSRQFVPQPNARSHQQVVDSVKAKVAQPGGKVHMFMQFYEMPDLKQSNLLKELGVEYQGYIPNNTWIVAAPSSLVFPDSLLSIIRWVGEIQPDDKISPELREGKIGDWAWNEDGSVNIVVVFFMDIPERVCREILAKYGEIKSGPLMLNDWILKTSFEEIANLAVYESVKWIDAVPQLPQDELDGSRANSNVNAVQAAPYNLDGSDVDIGQWESGHGDTESEKKISAQIGHDDYYNAAGAGAIRIEVVEGNTTEHGSMVAGILIGTGFSSDKYGNGGAAFQWKGYATGAEIKSYTSAGSIPDEHKDAINIKGIDLSNNSWGEGVSGNYTVDSQKFDKLVRGEHGNNRKIPVVFSAGNSGPNWRTITGGSKASKNTIAVGNINSDDNSIANSSSRGPVSDGRIKPDLVAPGCEAGGDQGITSPNDFPTDSYVINACGTSFAAPAVTGITALMIQDYRRVFNVADPPPAALKALLICTANNEIHATDNKGPDYTYGWGRVDAKSAVDMLRDRNITTGTINGVGDTVTFQFEVKNVQDIKVTLVWDDPPGDPAAAQADAKLVNNLDLFLVAPNGRWYTAWKLDPSAGNEGVAATRNNYLNFAAIPANVKDTLNNVEQVQVDNAAVGTWQAKVYGANLGKVPQGFSIANFKAPDFGDAPDNAGNYPSLLDNNGARHLDYTREWLGESVNGDPDSRQVNRDLFDDGIVFNGPMQAGVPVVLNINVNSSGEAGRYNQAMGLHLYLYGWFDWNGDGDWDDAGELVVEWIGGPKNDGNPRFSDYEGPGFIGSDDWGDNGIIVAFEITPPVNMTDQPFYSRFRLTYTDGGVGVTGSTDFGEVEDYWHEIYTAIDLVSFTAEGLDREVFLEWETASEIDNAGFNIWRSRKNKKGKNKKEEYIKINPNLIPAEGSPIWEATYSYTDTDVRNGRKYYYKLEDIDTHGVSTYHGKDACTYGVDPDCEPVEARPRKSRKR